MKPIFQAYAKYNKQVNQDLLNILNGIPPKKITKKFKSFYPTIIDLLSHVLFSDIAWLRRFKIQYGDYNSLKTTKWLLNKDDELKKEFKADYQILFDLRKAIDSDIVNFIDELQEDEFTKILKYKNYKGEDTEKEIWKVLMQMFNHETHHRGMISAILDLEGVENDYSTLLLRI